MSFVKIDVTNKEKLEGRNCIILCNFSGKELTKIQNFSSLLGIKDQIVVTHRNGETVINDILEGKLNSSEGEGIKSKAIIFNAIAPAKLNVFVENLKKMKIARPLIATVTDISIEWTLNFLLENLLSERVALKKGKYDNH